MKREKKNEKQDKPGKTREKLKKTTVAAKKQSTKKILIKNFLCMLLLLAGITLAAYAGSIVMAGDLYYTIRNLVLCCSAALVTVFSFQAGRISGSFFYDDGEYPGRFLIIYLCGILCALVFTFLPVTGWMFLFFYVALARVSDSVTGICGGTSLLVLTTILCEQISLSAFLVYLLSGMIGVALFAHQKDEFYTAIPLGLALGSQLLLIFAGELLIQNKKLVLEEAIVPLANTVMNGILIYIFLQYYINRVAKKTDNLYLMLNDPEYEVMQRLREQKKEDYYCAIHTAYLAERITSDLNLDVRSTKCAAYYGHLPAEEAENIPFPEPVSELLSELGENGKPLRKKEAVIVTICYRVIREIQRINKQDEGKKADYGKLINQLFEKQFSMEALAETDITLSNLRHIKKRLLKEQMYYEVFMRRSTT
ncbi:MAG: hypothetical protein HDQ96_05325 [Lachnospiraceae bacterium]|nr:hypothetical protein [Lachnospiraceae bacterium]